jgi:hypothetical protein
MPSIDLKLWGTLAVVMLLVQAVCWLLARGLGSRLERRVVLCAWLLPLGVLAPWLAGNELLVPSDLVGATVPGAPTIAGFHRHDLLNDTLHQLLPWELEIRHALAARRLPFWSDTLEGGSSPWANPQAGALSPLQAAARVVPIQHLLLALLVLKLLVAFQGTWLLARVTGRSRASSLLAAAGFTLGGGLFAWALFPITATVVWVPWLAAGVIRLFRRPGPRVIVTTAAVTGALLLSGHPETAAFGGLFAAVCGLALRRRAVPFVHGFAAAALAAVLGFGLAAPHLLPFLAVVPDSQRAGETLTQTLTGSASLLYPPSWFDRGFAAFVLAPLGPHAFGRPYQGPFTGPFNWADSEAGYTGLVALLGSLVALLAVRDRRAWPFLGFAAASLLLASRFLPLARLLWLVPSFRVPAYARFLVPGSLALCIAGAFGIDFLLSRRRLPASTWVALGLAASLSLAVAADPWTLMLWALLAAAFVAAWRLPRRWGAVALAAILLIDLVPWSRSFLPSGHVRLFYPRTPFTEQLTREAGDPAVWRATGAEFLVYPNLLPVYGLAEVRPHNPLAPARYIRVLNAAFGFNPTMGLYFAPLRNLDHPLLDFLGARAVVGSIIVPHSPTLQRIDGGGFPPYTLLRNPEALPRWFFPRAVDAIASRDAEHWIAGMTDAHRVAIFREEAGAWRPAAGESPPPRAVLTVPGHIVLDVPAGGERLLATSIVWSRGWSARAGGRAAPVLKVDGAFLGVRLPAGPSRLELRFLPPGLLAGCAACALSGLTLLGLGWRGWIAGRPSGSSTGRTGRGRRAGGRGSGDRGRRRSPPGS